MAVKRYVRILFVGAAALFALNRFVLRPRVLAADLPEVFVIAVNSLPNLAEAIMGTLLLTGLGLELRARSTGKLSELSDSTLYGVATLLAGVYVVSQELRFHNLGGNNVYDPWDLAFSAFGLATTLLVLHRFGFASEE